MPVFEIVNIRERPELAQRAVSWFHDKWDVSEEEYLDSINECILGAGPVPQWYLALCGNAIAGGAGVIENDFHNRKDLSPNVCALYVEPCMRRLGLAGRLLEHACKDMEAMGIGVLYLITDHTSCYERYGWDFLCMVQGDGDPDPSRMYVHRA